LSLFKCWGQELCFFRPVCSAGIVKNIVGPKFYFSGEKTNETRL
jgi:hypothetical protein